VLGVGLLLVLLLAAVAYARTEVPEPDRQATAAVTRVLYSDGSEMGRVGDQNRILTTVDKVPADVREAVLAAEDRGFYTEPGISPRGIAGAVHQRARRRRDPAGRLDHHPAVRQERLPDLRAHLHAQGQGDLHRAEDDPRAAQGPDPRDYLNTIFFGRGASGIEVAANTYFGKPVDQLTVAEGRCWPR
jgi:membrane peptidoglycan carboxypeptidase